MTGAGSACLFPFVDQQKQLFSQACDASVDEGVWNKGIWKANVPVGTRLDCIACLSVLSGS